MMKYSYKQDAGNNCYERSSNTVQPRLLLGSGYVRSLLFSFCFILVGGPTPITTRPMTRPPAQVSTFQGAIHIPPPGFFAIHQTFSPPFAIVFIGNVTDSIREKQRNILSIINQQRKTARSFSLEESSCEIIPATGECDVVKPTSSCTPPTSVLILWDHHHPP
jgi:hypothetical protein